MNDNATTPANSRGERRGRGPGLLTVGDYVGKGAADAAQAVRRAGLRPGLDRSFGCAAELAGLIVEQEPPAGEQIARNAMITLYVAAPGQVPAEAPAELPAPDDGNAATPPLPEAPSWRPPVAISSEAGHARSRKRRSERRTAPAFAPTPPPPPTPPRELSDHDATAELTPALDTATPAPGRPNGEHEHFEGARESFECGSDAEFVLRADEVFAGGRGEAAPWRRVYPRTRGGSELRALAARVTRHPVISVSTCVVLLAWLAMAFTSAKTGRRADARASAVAAHASRVERLPTGATGPEPAHGMPRSAARALGPQRPRAHGRPVNRPVRQRARTPPAHIVPASRGAQQVAAPEPRAPSEQPTSGGPFSP